MHVHSFRPTSDGLLPSINMAEILEDERIFFRHAARYYAGKEPKKSYRKGDGDLHLTSHRVFFSAVEGGIIFETVWANVLKPHYSLRSQERKIVLLDLDSARSTTDGQAALFVLTGNDDLGNALENLRSHVNRLLSGTKTTRVGGSGGEPRGTSHTAAKIGVQRDRVIKLRKDLLESDIVLKKQYQDLVEHRMIMTDEEFWDNKRWETDDNFMMSSSSNKGKLLSLYSDIQTCGDRDKKLDMTAEIVQEIFTMKPAVKRAYEDLVPTTLTGEEFWARYLQSEYYQQDKGGNASSFTGIHYSTLLHFMHTNKYIEVKNEMQLPLY